MSIIHLDFTPEYPAWLWVEWYLGGIKEILETWQNGLMLRYDMSGLADYMLYAIEPDIERAALENIHREARALRRYEQGHYRNVLKPYERRMMDLEIEVMNKLPHLKGRAKYEWITERMNQAGDFWTPRQIADILDETGRILADMYDVEMHEKMMQTGKQLAEIWAEAVNEMAASEAA